MSDRDETARIFARLKTIKPGERIVYFRGPALNGARGDCPEIIRAAAWESHIAGKAVLVQRRSKPPFWYAQLDYVNGVGEFEFIAIGKAA